MSKIINWVLSIGYPTAERKGSFEVDDDETDESIDEMVLSDVMNYVDYSWEKKDAS